ncbi:MAG: transposase [Opitutaceae bacterium]|nr:transposase [Opitutaceae bacterium]
MKASANATPQAQRDYSRDQRPGNKQVCIGLVCTPEGLPLAFEVFSGNRADVTTVEDIVRAMETKYGQTERIRVMDSGMVSEAARRDCRSTAVWTSASGCTGKKAPTCCGPTARKPTRSNSGAGISS